MSQILIPPAKKPDEDVQKIIKSVADLIVTLEVHLKEFDVHTPVQIRNGKLEVNEKLLEKDKIYSVIHKGENYYVRRTKGATEIFQLAD